MDDDQKQCPACSSLLTFIGSAKGDVVAIICPKCDHYEMDGPTVGRLRKYHKLTLDEQKCSRDLNPDEKKWLPYLSEYIQSETKTGNIPRLGKDWTACVRAWKKGIAAQRLT